MTIQSLDAPCYSDVKASLDKIKMDVLGDLPPSKLSPADDLIIMVPKSAFAREVSCDTPKRLNSKFSFNREVSSGKNSNSDPDPTSPKSASDSLKRQISRQSNGRATASDDLKRTISRDSFGTNMGFNRMISGQSFKRAISGTSYTNHDESDSGMKRQESGSSDTTNNSQVPDILSPMAPTKADDLWILDIEDFEAKYQCQKELGKGGFGVVRKGIVKDSKKPVAIKTIKMKELTATNAYGKEMIVTWMMKHPNLVALYDCFSDETTLHLVLEFLSGLTIHSLVQRRKKFGEPRGLPGAQQEQFSWAMLCAVAYLHHHKIAHRDCKTENFMQESDCETAPLKLIDFGLAMRVPRGEFLTEKVGTPEYAAPEVAKGSYNEKCDIWSIGIVAYIICVGYQPFAGKTAVQVMKKVRDTDAKFDPDKWDLVKPHLKELVQDMLVKDPNVRTTAKKLADANREWFSRVRETEKQAQAISASDQQPACCVIS
mmetsp:Transcript_48418/g.85296  ORF Transcript_48418/g.85296 Transcript_48418/m.85296 type:complete len:486 (-) Transcript_48418:105-1562(-)